MPHRAPPFRSHLLALATILAAVPPLPAADPPREPAGFDGARWIWYSREPMPAAIDFPASAACFRGTFELPPASKVAAAEAIVTADNLWLLHVNGQPAATSEPDPNAWSRARRIDISQQLRPGRNVLAVHAANTAPGPAALVVAANLRLTDGSALRWISSADWKCSDRATPRWEQPDFDDSAWQAAHVVGDFGMAPWGRIAAPPAAPPPAAPAPQALRRLRQLLTSAARGGAPGPPPPPEIDPPADFAWPAALVFVGDDCSLYRPPRHSGTSRDSLNVTIFNPHHTRAYPEHDLPAPVKIGRTLKVLSPAKPGVEPRTLLHAGTGAVGPPAVSHDGQWIYFPMAPAGGAFFHLYRIPAAGGTPEQLTDGPFHDIDPCELPDGRLVFSSTRIGRFEEYHNPPSRALFLREPDGAIHPLTHTFIFDHEPKLLADGRILLLRSDNFFDRGKVETQLHAIYPDGTSGVTEFGLDLGPEYGGRLRAFNAGSAAPMPDGRVAWVDGTQVLLGRPGAPDAAVRRLPIGAADLAALPDGRLLCTVTNDPPVGTETAGKTPAADPPAWPFLRLALLDPDAAEPGVVVLHDSPAGALHSPAFLGPRPRPPRIAERVNAAAADRPGLTGIFHCQDARLTRHHTAGWRHVRAIRVLAGRGLTFRSSHSYLVHAGSEVVELGTVPLAPDGSFAVEVPADTAIAFQAVDAEGRSELNQMSWIYVRPGESRGCIGCHQPRQHGPAATPTPALAMRTPPLKLLGGGDPLRFRGNNAAVTGLMELQFDRFREVAGINRHGLPGQPDASGKDEVAALAADLAGNDLPRRRSAAARAAVFRDPSCAPALARCLTEPDRELRVAAALALAACGTNDSIPPLANALADPCPLVAQAAAIALENLRATPVAGLNPFLPPAARAPAIETWRENLTNTPGHAWLAARTAELNGGDRDLARRAAVALGRCGGPAAAPALQARLLTTSADNPFPAWRADHGRRGDGARFNSLAPVNPRSLQEIARALGATGGEAAVPVLTEIAAANLDPETGNLFLAEAAVEGLARTGSPAAETALLELLPKLPPYPHHCRWYGDHDALIACHAAPLHARTVEALDALASRGAGPHVPTLVRMVPTDPDRALLPANDDFETLVGRVIRRSGRGPELAEACLHVLGGPAAAAPDPGLVAALRDVLGAWAGTPSPEIRAAQILSLVLRDPALEPRARAAFERYQAQPVDIPRVFDTGIPVVTKLPARHWVCFYLARTLGQLGQPASLPALTSALDPRLAEAASGRPDPLGPGVLFLHNDLTPCWRAAAAWALGRLADPAATPALLAVLTNLDNAPDTRHAAATALARTARPTDLPALRHIAPLIPEVSTRHALLETCAALKPR